MTTTSTELAPDHQVDLTSLIAQIDQHTGLVKNLLDSAIADRARTEQLTQAVESLTAAFGQFMQAQPQIHDRGNLLRRSWDRFVTTVTELKDRILTAVTQNPLVQKAAERTAAGLDMAVAGMDWLAGRLIAVADRASQHAETLHRVAGTVPPEQGEGITAQPVEQNRPTGPQDSPAHEPPAEPGQQQLPADQQTAPEKDVKGQAPTTAEAPDAIDDDQALQSEPREVEQQQSRQHDAPQAESPAEAPTPTSEAQNLLKVVAWPTPKPMQHGGARPSARPAPAPPAAAAPPAPAPSR